MIDQNTLQTRGETQKGMYGEFHEIAGGITAAQGFRAAGIFCGIKWQRKDLALVLSDVPAAAGAVLTTNKVQAAPVIQVKEQLREGTSFRALVVNSGNANACTGEQGYRDAWTMAESTSQALGILRSEVFVSSTGVIGQFLPMDKIMAGIRAAAELLTVEGGANAAEAIMTTDTFSKQCAVEFTLGGKAVRIGGMAKGSGMIAPNMATMLAFVTTDAAVAPKLLQQLVREISNRSFNRITVDGDTSTNDMVIVMANGKSGAGEITDASSGEAAVFAAALEHVLVRLSKMIVVDGEGATKFVEITVTGARTEEEAVAAARAVANSNLVKTAIHGEDANWGRILCAVGYSGIEFNPDLVEIHIGGVPILRQGYRIDFSEEEAKKVLVRKEIAITIALHQGEASATFWTCDLSKDYVAINANYRT
jgi:glutamate N-acetyltransferase / amino-acid N-acetyltransferase